MKVIPVQKEKAAAARQPFVKTDAMLRGAHLMSFGIPLLFFCCFFVFLLRYIDPAVVYSSNGIKIHTHVAIMHAPELSASKELLSRHLFILELTPEYLREIAIAPGGWTRFAVTLFIYACHYPIAGALAVTGLAFFFYWIFTLYILGTGARRPFVPGFVPAFFIMTMCAWYELGYCAFLLPVAGALALVAFYQRLRPATVLTRALWLSVLFWLAWYLMQWGCLLVLLFIVIHDLFCKEHRVTPVAIVALVNGMLLYFVDARIIPLTMTIRWSDFTILSGLPLAVIVFFPVTAIILAAISRFFQPLKGSARTIGTIVQISLLLFGTVAATVWLCRDPVNRDTRIIAQTAHHILCGEWQAVLNEKTKTFFAGFPQKAGQLQIFMVHAVDHALCRTGHLGDRLFDFPQAAFAYDPLLMLESMSIQSYVNWLMVLDIAMDLGMVNTAEKTAGEIMENMGPYPDILYRRALVQIAKGNRDAAAVYLGRLAHMPFYRAEARRLLSLLGNNEAPISEPRIAAMCANRDTVDYFLNNNLSCDLILKNLLQSNPGNKTAYDYLMTFCLLTGKLNGLSILAPMASTFGYTTLPRCWSEALYYFRAMNSWQNSSSEISYSGIQQETVERFKKFTEAWLPIENDPGAAAKLAPVFRDSYFYFSVFRYSPGTLHE